MNIGKRPLPPKAIAALNRKVLQHNLAANTDYDLEAWLYRHCLELAVQDDIAAAIQGIQDSAQRAAEQAVVTAREGLITALDDDPLAGEAGTLEGGAR